MQNIQHIKLENLDPPEFDAHFDTDTEADQELVESIKLKGVLLPLIVRKIGKRFEIVAGNRRFRCAGRAGLPAIPCIVSKYSDQEAEEVKSHENLHRLDLSHIEQGRQFLYLQTKFNLNLTQISEITKKSVPFISQHISLLSSSDEMISAVHEKEVAFSVARELMRIKNPDEQKRFLSYAKNGGATTPIVKQWVDEWIREEERKPPDLSGPVVHSAPDIRADPEFICHTCLCRALIKEMVIWRICPTCDHALGNAVKEEREKAESTTDVPSLNHE